VLILLPSGCSRVGTQCVRPFWLKYTGTANPRNSGLCLCLQSCHVPQVQVHHAHMADILPAATHLRVEGHTKCTAAHRIHGQGTEQG
jgi:hypothetical protein